MPSLYFIIATLLNINCFTFYLISNLLQAFRKETLILVVHLDCITETIFTYLASSYQNRPGDTKPSGIKRKIKQVATQSPPPRLLLASEVCCIDSKWYSLDRVVQWTTHTTGHIVLPIYTLLHSVHATPTSLDILHGPNLLLLPLFTLPSRPTPGHICLYCWCM